MLNSIRNSYKITCSKLFPKPLKMLAILKTKVQVILKPILKCLAGVIIGLLLFCSVSFGSDQHDETSLQTLTVTAHKVEEDALKIPVSVSVFSDTLLEDAKISNIMEMTRFTPNVYMKKSTSENMISIRGSPRLIHLYILPQHYTWMMSSSLCTICITLIS